MVGKLLAYLDKESIDHLGLSKDEIRYSKTFDMSNQFWFSILENMVCVCDIVYKKSEVIEEEKTDIDCFSLQSFSTVFQTNSGDFVIYNVQDGDGYFPTTEPILTRILDGKNAFQELQKIQESK